MAVEEEVTGFAERTVTSATACERPDVVIVEEPLEIRIGYGPLPHRQRAVHSIAMRTPGYDCELALGLLFTDRVISSRHDVIDMVMDRPNECRIELNPDVTYDPLRHRRTGFSSSACGICGTLEIERLTETLDSISSPLTISATTASQLPIIAREHQSLFRQTGGCHAAARFDRHGQFRWLSEDVGRHNALDQLIGHAVLNDESMDDSIVVLSGRAGFEMVQKAAVAQVPILIAVGAPTSLAVDLAEKVGMTLIGFVRDADFNIYSHPDRVTR